MPHRDRVVRLEDIVEAIKKVQRYTADLDVNSFTTDERTRDAVIWNLSVIGETAGLIPVDVQSRYTNIPWARMRGMRNVVIHEYFGIDDSILWETVSRNLPPLLEHLAEILERERTT